MGKKLPHRDRLAFLRINSFKFSDDKPLLCFVLCLGPAKVNKVKNFLGPYYMIKHVLPFVSGLQEFVLVDFISQNKAKILYKIKIGQNSLHQKFPNPYKNEKT